MKHPFKKMISLTLVAAFLLGLFPALDTPAGAKLIPTPTPETVQVVAGLTATSSSGDPGEWGVVTNGTAATISGVLASGSSTLTLTNTSGAGNKILSFAYTVTKGTASINGTPVSGTDTYSKTLSANETVAVSLSGNSAVNLTGVGYGTHAHDDFTFATAWGNTTAEQTGLPAAAGSYFLTHDVILSETWQPTENINLCLNGHMIRLNTANYNTTDPVDTAKSVIWLNASSKTLNIYDCNGSHGSHEVDNCYAGSGTVIISGGVITGGRGHLRNTSSHGKDTAGGGAYITHGNFGFYGGTIAGNTAQYGAGIYAQELTPGQTVQITLGGTAHVSYNANKSFFEDPQIGHSAGICVSNRAHLIVNDNAEISYNKAIEHSGGIGVEKGGSVTINGGSITHNHAKQGGGVALTHLTEASTVTINGGSITDNTAETAGAGLLMMGGEENFKDSLILSGATQVTGNAVTGTSGSENRASNLVPNTNAEITIGGDLTGAEIGVDFDSSITFASADNATDSAAGAAVFTSDRGGQTVELNGTAISLLPAVAYTVEHYQQAADGNYPAAPAKTEQRAAQANSSVSLSETDYQSYEGFSHVIVSEKSKESGNVGAADNSLTLKAYYQRNSYQVTYVYSGETPADRTPPAVTSKCWGAAVDVAGLSARSGYRFSGWSTTDVTVENGSFTMPQHNVTFTGIWERVYNISYNLAGGTVAQANPTTYVKSDNLTLNNPTKTGYTFAGWTGGGHMSPATTVTISESTGDLHYTANWTPVTYNITYDLAGGAVSTANPASYTIGTTSFTLHNPTRAGYTFAGWTGTGLSGARTSVTIAGGNTGARSYTATWTPITYTISYTLNGGTVSGTNPAQYTVESGAITLINPTRSGYAFKGWSGTGLTGDSSLTVIIPTGSMENRSYTANWTETQYTITYDLAGGTASPANPGGYNTTTQTFTLTNPTKTGYTFAGWTGTGLGSAMQSVTVTQGSTGNRSYTATWTKDTYTISYDLAGGSVTSANPTSYDVETNAFTLHNPTREHYTFAGWTGTGLDNAAQSVTVAKGSTGNRSYTAAWTPVNYSISYNLNGGNLAEGETNPNQYNIETTTFTLNNPIRTGYTFAGWTGTGLGSATQSVTVTQGSTGSRSYAATWQVGYDLRFHRANGTIVTIGLTAAQNVAANATAPSLTGGYNFWWYGVDKSRVDGGAAINGILQSRDYTEYKYLVTFNDGTNSVQLPCDGSVTAPDGLPSGMVWRSGDNIYVDGGHEVSVSADTTFTSAARQSISSADVGITAPVYGNSPDPAATVSAAAPYTVGVVAWTRDGTPLAGTFARGVHYTATVTLTPKPGWQFTGGTDVTLGGRSATPTPNGDGTVTVSLDFFLPTVKGTDWTWAGDYSSAKVTVTYVLGDGTTAAETIDPAAVAAPATGGDGSVTYSATAAGSAAYGSQTVESTLTVTRSGGTVTGVTVKKRLNGAQTLNVTLTANGGTITENGGGDFSVSGASVTVVNGTTYTLHENGSARLTANGAVNIEKGSATVSGDTPDGGSGGTGGSGGSGTGGSGTGGSGGGASGGGGASYSYVVEGPFNIYGEGTALSDTLYEDVNPDAWYYDSVAFVANQGWMTGVTDNTFAPGDNTTRAMIVTVLHRMSGAAAPAGGSSYTDVTPERYYAGAVAWAQENGITLGVTSNLFRPEEAVTREQFVTFLYRYALYRSMNTEGRDDLSRYTDWETVSSYAENPMQWASDAGIIVGRSILLAPHEPATRAEIATMLARFSNIYGAAGLPV